MDTFSSGRVLFGAFELDLTTGELRSAATPGPNNKVILREQVFQVLRMLVEREGKIVTREEIKSRLWVNDTVVDFDQSINTTIKTLRRALGDSADNPRYIETVGRRGYRLLVTTDYLDSAPRIAQEQPNITNGQLQSSPGAVEKGFHSRGLDFIRRARGRAGLLLAAVALLAIGAFCIWRYEVYLHRIALAPTDTIVLADIDNLTADPVFDDALTTALRYEMQQTPYLNVLGLDKTYASMAQLKLAPTTKITPEIARHICSQTNSKMVISDSLADAGNRYHLQIRAFDCGTGAILAQEQTDVTTRDQVVHELGVSAARLRRKLGEPAESVQRFNQPLEKATSASLEALQTGTEGTKLFLTGNPQAALPLYQRGIELDPDLALTYEGIGSANSALRHYGLAAAAYTRAYQLRDRMTEKDRLNAEYLYYCDVTGELEKARSTLVRALDLFPRDVFFHDNLAHLLLGLGQLNRAADLADQTTRLDPSPLYFSWAAGTNILASRLNEARSWLDQAEASRFDSPGLRIQRFRLAFFENDRRTLDRIFNGEAHGPNHVVFLRSRSDFEVQRGHFDAADRLRLQALRLSSDPKDSSHALVFFALENAEAGRAIQAHKAEDEVLQSELGQNEKMVLALSLARSGRTEEAERLAADISQQRPLDTIAQNYVVPTVRAAVKLQQHDPGGAIDLLRRAAQYELAATYSFDSLYPAYLRGLAHLELGDGRSAAPEFQKLIDNPGMCWDFITGPLARLQLARAERLMGDNASAREYYEEFLNIWKDADPDLPVYRQAKAEYAQLRTKTRPADYVTSVVRVK